MVDVLMKPKAAIKKHKKTSFTEGLTYYLLATFVVGIILAIMTAGTAIPMIVLYPVTATIGLIITGFVVWVIAKVLGCKAEVGNFLGLLGVSMSGIALLSWIPFVGVLASLYGLYILYVMLTEGTGMESVSAIITILIPIVLLAILAVVIAALVVTVLGAFGLGALAGALTGALTGGLTGGIAGVLTNGLTGMTF